MQLPYPERFSDDTAFGFDDVKLMPGPYLADAAKINLSSRLSANIPLSLPFLITVSKHEQAIEAAQDGILGIVPHTLKPSEQASVVRNVKRFQARVITDPITVTTETSLAEVLDLQTRYDISGIPVIDEMTRRVMGLVTKDNIKADSDSGQPISNFMSQDGLIMLQDSGDIAEVEALMRKHGVKRIILTDRDQRCIGMVTTKDLDKISGAPNARMDNKGRLRVGASVGVSSEDMDRVTMLIDEQVDVIMVVADLLHHKNTSDMVTHIRRQRAGHVDVIVGPVMTTDAARSLIDAGANALFMRPHVPELYAAHGIAMPALSTLMQIADIGAVQSIPVFMDGLTHHQHHVKALAAGVHAVMVDEIFDLEAESDKLREAMQLMGCASLEQLHSGQRFISLK